MNFSALLNHYRKRSNFTKRFLADKLGVQPSYIGSIENGHERAPTPERCKQLAEALRLTESEKKLFINIAIKERANPELTEWLNEKAQMQEIPIVSWVFAGRFEEAHDSFPPGIADEHVIITTKGENMFALKVKSDCMEPEFVHGDVIVINPNIDPVPGNFVVVRDVDNNEATFKQLKKKNGKLYLHPLNPKYKDIDLDHDKKYKIVGKVVEKVKKY